VVERNEWAFDWQNEDFVYVCALMHSMPVFTLSQIVAEACRLSVGNNTYEERSVLLSC
jgi:hypothetical protein